MSAGPDPYVSLQSTPVGPVGPRPHVEDPRARGENVRAKLLAFKDGTPGAHATVIVEACGSRKLGEYAEPAPPAPAADTLKTSSDPDQKTLGPPDAKGVQPGPFTKAVIDDSSPYLAKGGTIGHAVAEAWGKIFTDTKTATGKEGNPQTPQGAGDVNSEAIRSRRAPGTGIQRVSPRSTLWARRCQGHRNSAGPPAC